MIDEQSKIAIQMLEIMAEGNFLLIEFAHHLRQKPKIHKVVHQLFSKKYQNGTILEGFVDAELKNGKAVAWHLDIQWNDLGWLIEYKIVVINDLGQDSFKEFPIKKIQNFEDFCKEFIRTIHELTESFNQIDLENL